MDFSKVEYEEVETSADELRTSASNMETVLNEIKMQFDKIGTDEVWNGTAAAQAKARFDELSSKFPKFSEAVNNYATYLHNSVENYRSVDTSATNAIGQ